MRKNGFTLAEVVVSTLLVSVAIVALLSAFFSGLLLIESSRNMATAASDGKAVFEEIRRLSSGGLSSVLNANWPAWVQTAGLTSLPNERIQVSYRNRLADPLEATVTVNWRERNRPRSASFVGLVTKR